MYQNDFIVFIFDIFVVVINDKQVFYYIGVVINIFDISYCIVVLCGMELAWVQYIKV